MKIDIAEVGAGRRSGEFIGKLLEIWEASVRASHHFLTEDDITSLFPQAEDAIRQIPILRMKRDK